MNRRRRGPALLLRGHASARTAATPPFPASGVPSPASGLPSPASGLPSPAVGSAGPAEVGGSAPRAWRLLSGCGAPGAGEAS